MRNVLEKLREYGLFRASILVISEFIMPRFRFFLYKNLYKFAKVGNHIKFYSGIEFVNPNLTIDDNVFIGKNVRFGGKGKISIGANTGVGAYTCVESIKEIKIGKDCQIARFCYFIDHNHYFKKSKISYNQQTTMENDLRTAECIVIEDNCWIGVKTTILKGVTVGTGSVIGAGSVVTRDVPKYSVVAGVPAKVIKKIK